MKQYIITEKLLDEISTIDRYTTKMNNRLFAVRSNPYNPQAEREYTLHFLEAKLKRMRNLDYTDMYPVNECLINWIRELREGKDGE